MNTPTKFRELHAATHIFRHVAMPAACFGLALSSPLASAASDAWSGTTDATWATATNWAGSGVPGTGNTATFNGAGNGHTTIDLGAGVTLGALLFDTSSAAAYTIGAGSAGSQTLTLDNAGAITVNSGVTTDQLLNANVQLGSVAAATATFTNNGTGSLTIAGTVNANVASGNGLLTVGGTGNTTITGTITKSGAGNNALKKIDSGTLTLSNGSVWSGTGAAQSFGAGSNGNSAFTGPFIVQEGTLLLNGGTHTVTGEAVIGGITAQGGAGQNAKLQMDSGALNISSYLSLGRGNGIGGVSSDVVLNNSASITAVNFSAGYNGGNTANLPKGTVTMNGTSSFTINNINGVFNLAESAGSDMTMTLSGSSVLTSTSTKVNTQYVGNGGTGTLNINDTSTANFAADVHVGSGSAGNGRVNLNGGTLNFGTAATKWFFVGDAGVGRVDVNSGTWKLENNSSIKFSNGAGVGEVINQNGGVVTFYSNAGTTVGGTGALDMQLAGSASSNNTYNLNGGTLTLPQIVSTLTTGTRTFNFNGGTLKSGASGLASAFFNSGVVTIANVRDGGAIIDTNGNAVTIAQALVHSTIGGDNATDGGLTKAGLGTLTLSGANTYTGATTVNVGMLALASTGSLASTACSIGSGATFDVSAKASYSLSGINLTIGSNGTTAGLLNAGTIALTLSTSNLAVNFTSGTLVGSSLNLLDFGSQTGDFGTVTLTGSIIGSLALTGADLWTGSAGGYSFSFDETSGVLSFTAVPEPQQFAVAVAFLLGVMVVVRRRRWLPE